MRNPKTTSTKRSSTGIIIPRELQEIINLKEVLLHLLHDLLGPLHAVHTIRSTDLLFLRFHTTFFLARLLRPISQDDRRKAYEFRVLLHYPESPARCGIHVQ